jgi:plastocyanin
LLEAEMVRVRLVALILSGVAALALAGSVLAANASVRITESNNRYSFGPAKVFVNVGQAVTWTNGSDAPHTVTSNSGTELASSNINAGGTFSHTFNSTGTFAYHCTIHTYMKGSVVVLAAGVTPPASDTVEPPAASQTSPAGAFAALALLVGSIVARLYLRLRRA